MVAIWVPRHTVLVSQYLEFVDDGREERRTAEKLSLNVLAFLLERIDCTTRWYRFLRGFGNVGDMRTAFADCLLFGLLPHMLDLFGILDGARDKVFAPWR